MKNTTILIVDDSNAHLLAEVVSQLKKIDQFMDEPMLYRMPKDLRESRARISVMPNPGRDGNKNHNQTYKLRSKHHSKRI